MLKLVKSAILILCKQLYQSQFIAEMVKHCNALEQCVLHVGCIVLGLGLILDVYVLKVTYGVECGKTVQTAVIAALAFY